MKPSFLYAIIFRTIVLYVAVSGVIKTLAMQLYSVVGTETFEDKLYSIVNIVASAVVYILVAGILVVKTNAIVRTLRLDRSDDVELNLGSMVYNDYLRLGLVLVGLTLVAFNLGDLITAGWYYFKSEVANETPLISPVYDLVGFVLNIIIGLGLVTNVNTIVKLVGRNTEDAA